MAITRGRATQVNNPPPLPKTPPPPKRGRKKKSKVAAEKDDVGERPVTDTEDVTMADVTVTDVRHVTSGKGRKTGLVSKSEATNKRKLDETDSEAEPASEAPTGDFHGDDDGLMSELSSLDETEPTAAELTPKPVSKPPKKRAREAPPPDTPAKPSKAMVNATHHTGASKGKLPVGGPAGASLAFPMNGVDLAAWMGVPSETATAKATKTTATSLSSKEVARAGRSVDALPAPSRTKAVPPPAFAKPPKPAQKKPFQPDNSPVKAKGKAKQRAVVESDDEEPERAAALSSPPKGGARPTSNHVIKIKEEQVSPRPAKLSINLVEPTPRKNDSDKPADNKRSSRKEKRKVVSEPEDDDSSGIEIVEDPPQTLQLPRSQNASRSQSRSRSHSASRSGKTWRFEELPDAAKPRWKPDLLPTLLRFQGARHDPWSFADSWSVPALQLIWDAVYGDEVPHQVVAGDCVHGFANQCLYNWRSAIRAASECVVGTFFQENSLTRTLEDRVKFSTKILDGKRYLYENPFDDNNKRLFRSNFFLTILAWHLDATKNAVDVPGLFDGKKLRCDRPIGAFGLAGAALERIFTLFTNQLMQPPVNKDGEPTKGLWRAVPQVNPVTGKTSTSQTEFSDRRFSSRTTYFITCADGMASNRFDGVLVAAQKYMGLKRAILKETFMRTMEDGGGEELLLEDGDSD